MLALLNLNEINYLYLFLNFVCVLTYGDKQTINRVEKSSTSESNIMDAKTSRGHRNKITALNATFVIYPKTATKKNWPTCDYNYYTMALSAPCGFDVKGIPQFNLHKEMLRCTAYVKEAKTWTEARKVCMNFGKGRDLARPISPRYRRILHGYNTTSDLWIGLSDRVVEGDYKIVGSNTTVIIKEGDWAWPDHEYKRDDEDCIRLYRKKPGKIDDDNCNNKRKFVCDDTIDTSGELSYPTDERVNEGDNMKFTCKVSTNIQQSMKLTLKSGVTNKYVSVQGSFFRRLTFKSTMDMGQVRGNAKVFSCKFEYDHGKPRCLLICSYTIKVKAHKALESATFSCCSGRKCFKSINAQYNIQYFLKTGIYGLPKTGLKSNVVQNCSCLAILGKDKDSSGTVGVIKPDEEQYPDFHNKITEWSVTYSHGNNTLVEETGVKPDGIEVVSVKSGNTSRDKNLIVYVNITLTIDPAVSAFYKAKLFCRSNANISGQDKVIGEQHVTTDAINIKFPRGDPQLEILWEGQEGRIYVGSSTQAKYRVPIGSPAENFELVWYLRFENGSRLNWTIQRDKPEIPSPDWITFNQEPASSKCPSKTQSSYNGTCYRVFEQLLTWQNSIEWCREHFSYDLLTIYSKEHFKYLQDKIGTSKEGYYIGLRYDQQKQRFVWRDGTETIVEEWGTWYKPSENDLQWTRRSSLFKCVILHGGGLELFDCGVKMRFMCQSRKNFVPAAETYSLLNGPIFTSYITLKTRKFLDGAVLGCKYVSLTDKKTLALNESSTRQSSESHPFKFTDGQLKPTLTAEDTLEGSSVLITFKCSAYVGVDGRMTMTISYEPGFYYEWIVGARSYGIKTNNDIPESIDFYVKKGESPEQIGRYLEATMKINISSEHDNGTVKCYSYDTHSNAAIVSPYAKEKLQDVYTIHLDRLSVIPKEDAVDMFKGNNITIENDTQTNRGHVSLLMFAGVPIAILSICFVVLLVADQNERKRKVITQEGGGTINTATTKQIRRTKKPPMQTKLTQTAKMKQIEQNKIRIQKMVTMAAQKKMLDSKKMDQTAPKIEESVVNKSSHNKHAMRRGSSVDKGGTQLRDNSTLSIIDSDSSDSNVTDHATHPVFTSKRYEETSV